MRAPTVVRARPWLVLGALMAVASVVIYRKGFGTTFYFDDWSFLMDRRPWRSDIFFEPYNGHLAAVPIAIYKLLFVTVGIDNFAAYRLTLIGFHLLCVALLFVYVRRRLGDPTAVVAAASLLFLGSAWHDLLVPFQISFLFSVAAGLGALLLLDRPSFWADVGVAVLVVLALGSSSIGIPVAVLVLAEVLWQRDRWRRIWVPLVPVAVYLAWYLDHRDSPQGAAAAVGPIEKLLPANLPIVPSYAVEAAAGALAGLAGLGVEWGRPAVAFVGLLLVARLVRPEPISPRVWSLMAAAGVYWALLGLLRAQVNSPSESRYVYFGALLVLLIAAEMFRGARISARAVGVLALLVAVAAVGNFGVLRDGSLSLQEWSGVVTTELGALELAGPTTDPTYRPDPTRLPPVTAGAYFASVRELGSPADTADEIMARSEGHHQIADTILVQALRVAPVLATAVPERGARPAIDGVEGGDVSPAGPCIVFRPGGAPASLDVTATDGILVRVRGAGAVEYRLRSFADTFPQGAHGSFPERSTNTLRLPRRGLPRPWHVRVTASTPLDICGPARAP